MAFKLSAQLDQLGNPNLAFELYESYIDHNKWRFPESALEVIAHPDWKAGSQSKAPYYSNLDSFEVKSLGSSNAELALKLVKEMYVETPFNILITYKGLFDLELPSTPGFSEEPMTWRYEQFLYFDAYHQYKIKDKLFTHQIEWTNGRIWSITARDIHVERQEIISKSPLGS